MSENDVQWIRQTLVEIKNEIADVVKRSYANELQIGSINERCVVHQNSRSNMRAWFNVVIAILAIAANIGIWFFK